MNSDRTQECYLSGSVSDSSIPFLYQTLIHRLPGSFQCSWVFLLYQCKTLTGFTLGGKGIGWSKFVTGKKAPAISLLPAVFLLLCAWNEGAKHVTRERLAVLTLMAECYRSQEVVRL